MVVHFENFLFSLVAGLSFSKIIKAFHQIILILPLISRTPDCLSELLILGELYNVRFLQLECQAKLINQMTTDNACFLLMVKMLDLCLTHSGYPPDLKCTINGSGHSKIM